MIFVSKNKILDPNETGFIKLECKTKVSNLKSFNIYCFDENDMASSLEIVNIYYNWEPLFNNGDEENGILVEMFKGETDLNLDVSSMCNLNPKACLKFKVKNIRNVKVKVYITLSLEK